MPYIKRELRSPQTRAVPISPGELNYAMMMLALEYTERLGANYSTMNAVVGAFECAKAEYLRRFVAAYEDAAIARNGDL